MSLTYSQIYFFKCVCPKATSYWANQQRQLMSIQDFDSTTAIATTQRIALNRYRPNALSGLQCIATGRGVPRAV